MSTDSLPGILTEMREDLGTLTPVVVEREARDPDHPLHHHFDWDDSSAGYKYRLIQAAKLLRVTYKPDPAKPTELRAFVAIKGSESHRAEYVPTEKAMADPFQRKLVLSQMEREWKSLKKRYEHMAEFAAMIRQDIA